MRCSSLPWRRGAAAVIPLIAFFLTACNSVLGPGELAGLEAGERRWAARPFANYVFEMRESCFFCGYYGWVRATVVDGVVVAAEATEPDTVPLQNPGSWPTIDALFAQIQRLGHGESTYRDLAVRFDAVLGYPAWIEARAAKGMLDAGFTIEVRAVSGR